MKEKPCPPKENPVALPRTDAVNHFPEGLQPFIRVITLEKKRQIFEDYWTLALN